MLLAVFVLTLPDSAPGDMVVVGSSHIIDADTIVVLNETICLASGDAPETEQHWQDAGGRHHLCGVSATTVFERKIRDSGSRGVAEARGRYGRLFGECDRHDDDLNPCLVVNGAAPADRLYSSRDVQDEEHAEGSKRGMW